MKVKIVVEVPIGSGKKRIKAMKTVSSFEGVTSVTINEKDQLEITGQDLDPVKLALCLRCKTGAAKIISVGEDKKVEEKKPDKPKKPSPPPTPVTSNCSQASSSCPPVTSDCPPAWKVYFQETGPDCTIL